MHRLAEQRVETLGHQQHLSVAEVAECEMRRKHRPLDAAAVGGGGLFQDSH
ncbi:MAG: hypothetical protein OXD35_07635 [Thiotrichales bacterium]|nr:hypothetical protein [Thiotrichales bacterium]